MIVPSVFVLVMVATYWPVAHSPHDLRWLGPGDAHAETGPNAFFMDYSIHHGEIPLWNPLNLCGTPFAANPVRFVFYPLFLIRSLLTFSPTPLRTHVGILLYVYAHFILAGVGAFLWARHRGLGSAASFVASFGFMLSSGFVFRGMGHVGFNVTLSWTPFLLLAVEHALAASTFRTRLWWAGLGGLIMGMVFLAGAPQMLVLVPFATGAYWLLYSQFGAPRSRRSTWRGWGKRLGSDLVVLALLFVIGVLVAAAMLIPAAEFSSFSDRAGTGAASLFEQTEENPPWNLFQLLAVYSGSKSNGGIKAAGAGILLLALASLFHANKRAVAIHVVLFFMLLDCAHGEAFPCGWFLARIAPFEMSNPPRAMLLACLPLGLLAGFGLDAVTASGATPLGKLLRTVFLLIAGATVLIALASCVTPHPFLAVSKLVLYIPIGILAVMLVSLWLKWPKTCGYLLAVLVFAETLTWNLQCVPRHFTIRSTFKGTLDDLRHSPSFWQSNQRGTASDLNHHMYRLEPAINGYEALHIARVRQVLCRPDLEKQYRRHVAAQEPVRTQVRGNLFLKRSFWLARQYVEGRLPGKQVPFPATTTVFLEQAVDVPVKKIARDKVPVSPVSGAAVRADVDYDGTFPIVVNPADLPDAEKAVGIGPFQVNVPQLHGALCVSVLSDGGFWMCPTFRDVETGVETVGQCYRFPKTGTNPRLYETSLPDTQRLEVHIKLYRFDESCRNVQVLDVFARYDPLDEGDLVQIKRRTANSVTLDVGPLPGYRILTFVDAHYPGWKAYVDSNPKPIYLANDAFKAVAVPPGEHEVRFVFRPWRVYAGVGISSSAALVIAGLLIGFRRIRL